MKKPYRALQGKIPQYWIVILIDVILRDLCGLLPASIGFYSSYTALTQYTALTTFHQLLSLG